MIAKTSYLSLMHICALNICDGTTSMFTVVANVNIFANLWFLEIIL